MKELTTEQKAKAYDEAIKKAKGVIKQNPLMEYLKKGIEYILPELKKSEDERIRTFLHHTFTAQYLCKDKLGKWHGEPVVNILAWLDKVEPKFKVGDFVKNTNYQGEPIYEIVYIDKECYICEYRGKENMGDKTVMHFAFDNPYLRLVEQKPADNKSQFHEGDWIVHHGTENIYQVVAIIGNQYQLKYGDNYTVQSCADVDRCARLWNITKDAKVGDILVDGNLPFIFKKIDTNKYSYAYCGISVDDGFKIESDGESGEWTWMQDIKPAIKEQRDTLMKAMTDAGYTFDFKEKVLKKIEQKFNIGDEIKIANEEPLTITKIDEKGYWSEDLFICSFDDAAKWELVEQKPDNVEYEQEINYPDNLPKDNWELIQEFVNKFGRIPKDEDELNALVEYVLKRQKSWSEEDEKMLKWLCRIVHSQRVGKVITLREESELGKWIDKWLNHNPQPHWKPSDEQLDSLYDVLNPCDGFDRRNLESLYQDLKKL